LETIPVFTTDFLNPRKQGQSRNMEVPIALHNR